MNYFSYQTRMLILGLLFSILSVTKTEAALSTSALNGIKDDPAFSNRARSFIQAITFSLVQPQDKPKLVGSWTPYIETGYHLYAVSSTLAAFTTDRNAPAVFQSGFFKGGVGLPYGFNVEVGLTQVVTSDRLTGMYGSIGLQVLDLANFVYVDIVPSVSISVTGMQVLSGPDLSSGTAQISVGVYHRENLLQLAGIGQATYATLDFPSAHSVLYRYGVTSNIPIYRKLYLKTDILGPDLSGSFAFGYQF
ncbi:MAG: hypothetical protein J0L93_05210 [Deltaproteobacteria bacterium]|nr:hypothetical protein [Deltaproteobacteria bacterium]